VRTLINLGEDVMSWNAEPLFDPHEPPGPASSLDELPPAAGTDPLPELLARALDRAPEGPVRAWLAGLLERGESAAGATSGGGRTAGAGASA
jgi:hypothetical protein